jgi:Skp family chaperone for outer membrane proteins
MVLAFSSAFPDQLRVARFDSDQVFNGYEHTKEIQHAISAKRHPMGPGSDMPSTDEQSKIEAQLTSISDKIKQHAVGTLEYKNLILEQQIAALQVEVAGLKRNLADIYRGEAAQEEISQVRAEIVKEICIEAKALASEKGYSLIIVESPNSGLLPNVILNSKSDDLTKELLKRLNDRYQLTITRRQQ